MLKKFFYFLVVSFLFINISCNSEDDEIFEEEPNIQTDAKIEDLVGIWSIFKVANNGNEAAVPANFEECGRDFFIYNESGMYEEFLFQENATCLPVQNKLKWSLNNGIITLSSLVNSEYETLKVKNVSKDNFVFIAELDLDGDNIKEQFTFTAYRYLPPNEVDIYSETFQRKEEDPFINHIEFGWDKYKGYNSFEKYEIYRSGKDCNINTATLLKTITDIDVNSFIEENPITDSEACYFLKIYTNKGLLGESDPRYINPEFIFPKNVNFINAETNSNSVTLSWEKYSGYYFSHYEIRVQDQNDNSNPNVESIKIITDINTTSFTDENPPFVNNPIYTIYVHNKFGNISNLDTQFNMIETSFIRPGVFDFNQIRFLSFDAESQSFFFYLKTEENNYRLIKYNYLEKNITAEAFKIPTSSTEIEMKLITSEEGKELIFAQAGDLWVYNSETLNFKYSLNPDYLSSGSFDYLGNNIWIVSDSDNVYTYKRELDKLIRIDEKPHFTDHQGSMNYEITKIDKNNILLSHNNEGRAIHFTINNIGEITDNGTKEVPLKFEYNSDVTVNSKQHLILNKLRNTVYSSTDFSEYLNYSIPKKTLNFNNLGTKILGTNNEVSLTNPGKDYKKELIVYDIQSKTTVVKATKGYPVFVMEDSLGNIVSLSTAFASTSSYGFYIYKSSGIFVEIVK